MRPELTICTEVLALAMTLQYPFQEPTPDQSKPVQCKDVTKDNTCDDSIFRTIRLAYAFITKTYNLFPNTVFKYQDEFRFLFMFLDLGLISEVPAGRDTLSC